MEKIMIIDDELESLEILQSYLEDKYEIFTFQSGAEALEQLAQIEPDLIMLDIVMPFMDGFEALAKIRAMEQCGKIPVIGISGQKNRTAVLDFLSKGGTRYFSKPVEKHFLQEEVSELLRQEEAKREKQKILIIDDELESLFFYKTVLQKYYSVMTLNSGKMALEYLTKFVPDLILLDYQMPLYNGSDMYQIIRKMDKVDKVPIMFLTGTQDKEVLDEISALVPDGVIRKAEGKDILLNKVRSTLKNG